MSTISRETINLFGGCETCARYFSFGGHKEASTVAHVVEHRRKVVTGLRSVFASGNRDLFFRSVVKAKGLFGGNQSTCTGLWALAMTLRYGPVGLHSSRVDANGYPLPETLAMDSVSSRMTEAADKVPAYLDTLERDVERFASNA